jgi:hypothetical protein
MEPYFGLLILRVGAGQVLDFALSPTAPRCENRFGNKGRIRSQAITYMGFRSRSASQPRAIR